MSDRIDIYVQSVGAKLAALPSLEERLAAAPTVLTDQHRVDRDDIREGWDLAMAQLDWLDERYAQSGMDQRQAEQYRALVCRARETLPTIKKLGLAAPPPRVVRRAEAAAHFRSIAP